MRRLLFVAVLLSATPALAARKPVTADDRERIEAKQAAEAARPKREGKDIAETVAARNDFKTLVALLTESGLTDMLKGDGPLTLFAPSDAAFKKVPKKQLDALKADKEKLKGFLLFHLVTGKLAAETLLAMPNKEKVRTVIGDEFEVTSKGALKVGKAKIVQADINANNGVVHMLDAVLFPEAPALVKKGKK